MVHFFALIHSGLGIYEPVGNRGQLSLLEFFWSTINPIVGIDPLALEQFCIEAKLFCELGGLLEIFLGQRFGNCCKTFLQELATVLEDQVVKRE